MPVFATSLAALGLAGGFGQFAFTHSHHLMGFDVSPTAFKVSAPGGMEFMLGSEREGLVVSNLSRYYKALSMRPIPGAPIRILYETTCLGFSMQYREGMLATGEGPAPFVTWSEGSVGPGVPSAKADWALLTWADAKPPILLAFDPPGSIFVTETTDGFLVESPKYSGTIRVRLPFGFESLAGSNAAQLGELSNRLRPLLPGLCSAAPQVKGAKAFEGREGVTGVWTFDRPGAILPPPLVNAVHTGLAKMLSKTEPGPSGFVRCSESQLRVGFYCKRLQPGLGLAFGPRAEAPATISEIDPQSVAEATLAKLCGSADSFTLRALVDATSAFRGAATPLVEPITRIALPYARDGSGSAVAAAHSFVVDSDGRNSSWFDALAAGLDWVTWLPAGANESERQRAAALMAMAGPFRAAPEDRLIAAMANAAAASLGEARTWLFGKAKGPAPGWFAALSSPIRLLTAGVAFDPDKAGFAVVGQTGSVAGFDVHLLSDLPLRVVSSTNVARTVFKSAGTDTLIFVVPAKPGQWRLVLAREGKGVPIPRTAPLPAW